MRMRYTRLQVKAYKEELAAKSGGKYGRAKIDRMVI